MEDIKAIFPFPHLILVDAPRNVSFTRVFVYLRADPLTGVCVIGVETPPNVMRYHRGKLHVCVRHAPYRQRQSRRSKSRRILNFN